MNRKHLSLAATTAVALFAASASFAQPGVVETRVAVNYADLDLSSPKGIDRLYSRLRSAAEQACGHADVRDLRARARVQSCYDGALEGAIEAMDNDALSALHFGSSPTRYAKL